MESVVFYILSAVLLGLGLLVITRTNPIASALAMVGAFAALAGLYALLSAEFIAIVQVLVYAGGLNRQQHPYIWQWRFEEQGSAHLLSVSPSKGRSWLGQSRL